MQIATFIFITWLKYNHVSLVRVSCSSLRQNKLWERLTKLHFNGATNYKSERWKNKMQSLRFLEKKYFVLFYWFDFLTISTQNLLKTNFRKNSNLQVHIHIKSRVINYILESGSNISSYRFFYTADASLCRLIQHLYYCTMAYEMIQLATWKRREASKHHKSCTGKIIKK